MRHDRRGFIKQIGTGVAAAAAVTKLSEQASEAATGNFTALAAPHGAEQVKLALELDGKFAGWVQSLEGGDAVGVVVEENDEGKIEGGLAVRKHIAGVKYEDITVTFGTGMSKAFFEWLKYTFEGKVTPRSGSITVADFNYNTSSVLSFSNALLTEIGFPALDADSKDSVKMTLKFSPQKTQYASGGGRVLWDNATHAHQKKWLASNFKFEVEGLDRSSSRVSKIEAFTVKQTIGGDFEGKFAVGRLEFPNLKITLAESDADQFGKWHEEILTGKGGTELDGKLSFFAEDKTTLLALDFSNLGLFKFSLSKIDTTLAPPDQLPQVNAEMYCEQMKFSSESTG